MSSFDEFKNQRLQDELAEKQRLLDKKKRQLEHELWQREQDKQRKLQEKYQNSVQGMIRKVLIELAEALWGKNSLWKEKNWEIFDHCRIIGSGEIAVWVRNVNPPTFDISYYHRQGYNYFTKSGTSEKELRAALKTIVSFAHEGVTRTESEYLYNGHSITVIERDNSVEPSVSG